MTRNIKFMWGLFGYSIVVDLVAPCFNLHLHDDFTGYWAKINWALFPFFLFPIFWLYSYTWDGFMNAWADLFDNGCISVHDNKAGREIHKNVIKEFSSYKNKFFIVPLLASLIVMYFDVKDLNILYKANPSYNTEKIVSKETDACAPKKTPKYQEVETKNPYIGRKTIFFSPVLPDEPERVCLERDWTAAWYFTNGNINKKKNTVFAFLAYIQQAILIFLAFYSLIHIWLHIWFFSRFEHFKIPKKHDLKIQLDYTSQIHEFGMERWNHALNNIYWALSAAMIISLVSKASQPSDDIGQVMLRTLVPLIFLSPMILTLIIRQNRLPVVWEKVRKEEEAKVNLYHKQLLWPLDRNWASKLGIVLSFVLLSLLVGQSFGKVLGTFM